MSDELLPFYQKELRYIRRVAQEFARAHPDDAASLRLGAERCDDPHVERMIEAFAYIAARIRHKLDDDFPEITDALLGVLYPHYLAPVPSMAIVEMELDRSQAGLAAGHPVPRGSALETMERGAHCRFQTCYPLHLLPIEVASATLGTTPLAAGKGTVVPGTQSVLRLELKCWSKDVKFSQLNLKSLRFFLKAQPQDANALYELIFRNTLAVSLRSAEHGAKPVMRDPSCLGQVGFSEDEGLMPYTSQSFPGYRLLTEYFAFPAKYLFFDVTGLDAGVLKSVGNALEITFYLDRAWKDLEPNVDEGVFRLGCTPVVNLFQKTLEPVILGETTSEYELIPDVRNRGSTEVYSIQSVTSTSGRRDEIEFRPFFSFRHARDRERNRTFWCASRRPVESVNGDNRTDVFLSFVDLDFNPAVPAQRTVMVDAWCLNGDLPQRLPFGGGHPRLRLEGGGPVGRIECQTAPTATLRPGGRRMAMWKLVSHLSLNHLSVADADESADALREILILYDHLSSPGTQGRIGGIRKVAGSRVTRRAGGPNAGGFCRGMEVSVLFDPDRYADNSLFLFASVLERFLALYCSINSFSSLVAHTRQETFAASMTESTQPEEPWRQWPARAGEKILL